MAPWLLPLLAAGLCYGRTIVLDRPLADDVAYACAARAVSAGHDPYECDRYIYPPLLAQLEAAAGHVLSEQTVQSTVRAVNVAASVWLLVFVASLCVEDRWRRALAAAVLLCWSPNLADALNTGNVGPLVCSLMIWSLSRWSLQPLAAGMMLGLSLALKPLGPAAWLLLAAHRPEPGLRLPQLKAAAVAALTAAALTWPGREALPQLAAHAQLYPEALHNLSLQRVMHLLGVTFAPHWQVLLVCAIMLVYVRRAPRSPAALMHLSCASVLLAQPIVWGHTWLIVYPALAAALGGAAGTPAPTPREHALRVLCVSLGCLCIAAADTFGDLAYIMPPPLAAAVVAAPLCAALALSGYASGKSA